MRPFALRPRGWGRLLTLMILLGSSRASGQNEAESLSASFRKAAHQILPAVVSVRPQGIAGRSPLLPMPVPIEPVLPGPGEPLTVPMPRDPGASGVVIDAEKGLVLTNDHVVRGASRIVVVLPDGREREARKVRHDPQSDLALLTIDPDGLQQAAWGDSEVLDTGDWVLAVGQPFGLSGTVTAGIVSSKGRGLGQALFQEDLIQTDAAINAGSSGGPLVNLKGEVVGINLAIKTHNGGYEGVGFAIPASRARRVAADLAQFGRVRRAYLGIEIQPVDPDSADRLIQPSAVAITGVLSGSPAAVAGLRAGDVVVKLNGKPAEGLSKLRSAIEFAPVDDPLELTIVRGGETREVRVRPEARTEPAERPEPAPAGGLIPRGQVFRPVPVPPITPQPPPVPDAGLGTRFPALGLRLAEMNPALIQRFGLDPARQGLVVIGVAPDGPADRAGLELGMLITDLANRRVTTLDEFRAALENRKPGQDLVVRIRKGSRSGFRVILDQGDPKSAPADEPKATQPPPPPSAPPGATTPTSATP
jgi:serine protease Do